MNLNSLFNKQKQLDEYIIREKELEGVDLLPRKTVALLAELYECVNEARFFKYWSKDQMPRTNESIECSKCDGWGSETDPYGVDMSSVECDECGGTGILEKVNPLLEEYIDTIHFALSIANDLEVHEYKYIKTEPQDLNKLVLGITNLATIIPISTEKHQVESLINNIITLGYQLGFNEEEVINAYHEKNKENYARQKVGY